MLCLINLLLTKIEHIHFQTLVKNLQYGDLLHLLTMKLLQLYDS